MKSLVLTLQFLTRLPLPWVIEGDDAIFARGVKYFPVAGVIIGLFKMCIRDRILSPSSPPHCVFISSEPFSFYRLSCRIAGW